MRSRTLSQRPEGSQNGVILDSRVTPFETLSDFLGLWGPESDKLKKAVAVSEEEIQECSRNKAGPIFQQPFALPENAQTLAGIAFRATRRSVNDFPAASRFARSFPAGNLDSHSLLEFSDGRPRKSFLTFRDFGPEGPTGLLARSQRPRSYPQIGCDSVVQEVASCRREVKGQKVLKKVLRDFQRFSEIFRIRFLFDMVKRVLRSAEKISEPFPPLSRYPSTPLQEQRCMESVRH